jgi:hypothetical protein
MDDLLSLLEPYVDQIVEEAKQWLLLGRPVPAFILFEKTITSAECDRIGGKSIGPADSVRTLLVLPYTTAMARILRFAEAAADFDRIVDSETSLLKKLRMQHSAWVLVELSGKPQLAPLDLHRDTNLLRQIEAGKLRCLQDLLEHSERIAAADRPDSAAHQLFHGAMGTFLGILLQRPPTQDEIMMVKRTVVADD